MVTLYTLFISFSSTPKSNTKQSYFVLLLFCNQTKNIDTPFYLSNMELSHSILESGAEPFRSPDSEPNVI
jgi:hypothetical protein